MSNMDNQGVVEAIDQLANGIEDHIENAVDTLGISVDEIIDRLANELKARNLGE